MRRSLVFTGCFLAAAAAAFGLTRIGKPAWRKELDRTPMFQPSAKGIYPLEWKEKIAELMNDVYRRDNWGDAEAEYLCGAIATVTDGASLTGATDDEKAARTSFQSLAATSVAERMRMGAPIEADAADRLRKSLLAELDSSAPDRRRNAAFNAVMARLIVEPAVRTKVESIASQQTDAWAVSGLRRHLDDYDKAQRTRVGNPGSTDARPH